MARNQTLLKILGDVRGEARLSLNPAHNIAGRDAQIALIQREQERLWADYDWPHLMVNRYIPAVSGRRYYDPRTAFDETWQPRTDLSLERVVEVSVYDGHAWRELCPQITDRDRFAHDSLAGERSWPPRRWAVGEDDVIEIWPTPDEASLSAGEQVTPPNMQSVIRVRGVRDLRPFRDDADRADLDDRLLSLYSASALLAESGAKDTNLKLEAAQRHYTRIKADQTKSTTTPLFGIRRARVPTHPYVSRYVRPE